MLFITQTIDLLSEEYLEESRIVFKNVDKLPR